MGVIQGGAGTSTNMNTNEVIANRGLEIMGFPRGDYSHLHPIDDVRFPTPFRAVTTIAGWALCAFDVAADEALLARQQEAAAQAAEAQAATAAGLAPAEPVPAAPRPTILVPPPGMSAQAAARAVQQAPPGALPGVPC